MPGTELSRHALLRAARAKADRPQKLPNPIDASRLYWLTRRLLTLVPELQAAELALDKPGSNATWSLLDRVDAQGGGGLRSDERQLPGT